MTQPLKKHIAEKQKTTTKKTKQKTVSKKKKTHKDYGTSKLEKRFAKDFLEKLGVRYIYQFEMGIIGRFLDYYLPDENIAIEVDGDYYHSYGKVYEEMNPMQKHNKRVDKIKNHWCAINNIKLLRIWEHDINKNPQKVMSLLKDELSVGRKIKELENEKKRRH